MPITSETITNIRMLLLDGSVAGIPLGTNIDADSRIRYNEFILPNQFYGWRAMQGGSQTAGSKRKKRIDWDGAWKEAIQQLFPAFLELLFVDIYALIDWSQEPVFLEQELRQITRRAKRGKGAVDKLARVQLLNGTRADLLIHIEFQNQVDPDLMDRLYTYNVRVYSLLHEPVISLAVLGDDDPNWCPTEFGYAYARFATRMRFPIAKLLDFEAQWASLEDSANPFAVIVMAHLKTLATMRRPESRLEWKLRLAKALYDRNYDEAQIQQLINFIDWLMVLDDQREARFDVTIKRYEEERTMPTVSRLEKRLMAKGLLEGQQQGRLEGQQQGRLEGRLEGLLEALREGVQDNLASRFDPIPEDITEAIRERTDQALLKKLHRAALQVATLDEFRSLL